MRFNINTPFWYLAVSLFTAGFVLPFAVGSLMGRAFLWAGLPLSTPALVLVFITAGLAGLAVGHYSRLFFAKWSYDLF